MRRRGFAHRLPDMEIVLASRSPRRLMLLQAAGFAVETRPSHVDESGIAGESAEARVLRLAQKKARACEEASRPVLAADTLVEKDGEILGQPSNEEEARRMIAHLAGGWHAVHTGVCLRWQGRERAAHAVTRVHFRPLDDEEIARYLAHNEVMDKAGAYAVQAGAASFIDRIEGPLDNVIGLPVQLARRLIHELEAP